MTRANDALGLPERGPARWISIGFMVLLAGLMIGLIYLGQRTERLSFERARLTAEMFTDRSQWDVEKCLGQPSGKGLALTRRRGEGRGTPLFNEARDFRATFKPSGSRTRVRLYSREGWPPGPQDLQNFRKCLSG